MRAWYNCWSREEPRSLWTVNHYFFWEWHTFNWDTRLTHENFSIKLWRRAFRTTLRKRHKTLSSNWINRAIKGGRTSHEMSDCLMTVNKPAANSRSGTYCAELVVEKRRASELFTHCNLFAKAVKFNLPHMLAALNVLQQANQCWHGHCYHLSTRGTTAQQGIREIL